MTYLSIESGKSLRSELKPLKQATRARPQKETESLMRNKHLSSVLWEDLRPIFATRLRSRKIWAEKLAQILVQVFRKAWGSPGCTPWEPSQADTVCSCCRRPPVEEELLGQPHSLRDSNWSAFTGHTDYVSWRHHHWEYWPGILGKYRFAPVNCSSPYFFFHWFVHNLVLYMYLFKDTAFNTDYWFFNSKIRAS